MQIIEPVAITPDKVLSVTGEVPENDYTEWVRGTTYGVGDQVRVVEDVPNLVSVGSTAPVYWYGLGWTAAGLYGMVNFGPLYFMPSGHGPMTPNPLLFSTYYLAACEAPNGNVYMAVANDGGGGGIYIQTGGAGPFVLISGTDSKSWNGVCVAPNKDVYAIAGTLGIYKQTGGTGSFTSIYGFGYHWTGICAAPNGDIYATGSYGAGPDYDIYCQPSGGSFSRLYQGNYLYTDVAADPVTGDIYATTSREATIYVRSGGVGNFSAWSESLSLTWYAIACDKLGNVWAGGGWDLYHYNKSTTEHHRCYQSLIANNVNYHPPSCPDAWLDLGPTNRYKPFDNSLANQASKATPMVYKIAPGVSCDSVAVMNCENTSVRVQTNHSPAYDRTISTAAKDLVFTDLAGKLLAGENVTITINKTGGTALVGEIVVGNITSAIGTITPTPEVGIIDYSIKEVDEWGNYTVTERAYSKKMSCRLSLANSSIDAVFNLLVSYRATPVVWVGNPNYTCMILYGFLKEFVMVINSGSTSWWELHLEGLT